jgi:hypothetical protein
MRLDPEKGEGQRHRQHRRGEEHEGWEHRVRCRLRCDNVIAAGEHSQRQRAEDLADAVGGLAEARRS